MTTRSRYPKANGRGGWFYRYRSPDGEHRQVTFRGKGAKAAAERAYADYVGTRGRDETFDPTKGRILFAELVDEFMKTTGARLRPASVSLYEMHLRRYILPKLGHLRLSSIGKGEVRRFEAEMLAAGKGEATVAAVHRLLHRLFAFAMEEDRIWRNPADLPRGEVPHPKPRPAVALTEVDLGRIAAQVPPRYQALLWTLAIGGLRVGEATGLRVRSLDLKAGTIRVEVNAPEVNGQKFLDQPTKTARSVRTVDIPPSLAAMLGDHLNRFGNRFDSSSLVFTNERGGPVRQSSFRKNVLQPAARRAGIDPVPRVHDLRHAAASFMGRAGYTLLEAAEQLGHSATSMTERYSHVFPDARQEKVARLDALIGGGA